MPSSAMDIMQEAYERQVAITTALAEAIGEVAPHVDAPERCRLHGALRLACGQTEALTAMLLRDAGESS